MKLGNMKCEDLNCCGCPFLVNPNLKYYKNYETLYEKLDYNYKKCNITEKEYQEIKSKLDEDIEESEHE